VKTSNLKKKCYLNENIYTYIVVPIVVTLASSRDKRNDEGSPTVAALPDALSFEANRWHPLLLCDPKYYRV
jgi:hypothetical protein